jgi:hypothetical protein
MKRLHLLGALAFVLCTQTIAAQSYDKTDRMGIILSTGYKHLPSVNTANSYTAFSFDFICHNHYNKLDFNGNFSYGNGYISCEPFSLIGILGFFFVKYGEGGEFNGGYTGLIIGASALSGLGFNIKLGDYLKIRPYYSLLRLSKIKDVVNSFTLNAAVGSYLTVDFGRIMINPFCEYGFGYKKNSPFTGANFGVSLGIKLYDLDNDD